MSALAWGTIQRHVADTELPCGAPVLATGPYCPGTSMATIFNRIFTTERLLQIILVLAATAAMKLMS